MNKCLSTFQAAAAMPRDVLSVFAPLNHLFCVCVCFMRHFYTHIHRGETITHKKILERMKVNTTINYEGNEKHTKQISFHTHHTYGKRDIKKKLHVLFACSFAYFFILSSIIFSNCSMTYSALK